MEKHKKRSKIMLRESRGLGCPNVRNCPKSDSGAEPRAEPSDFRTIGQFGSARLSVGQAKNFGPRLGLRSGTARIFARMPTPGEKGADEWMALRRMPMERYLRDPPPRFWTFQSISTFYLVELFSI